MLELVKGLLSGLSINQHSNNVYVHQLGLYKAGGQSCRLTLYVQLCLIKKYTVIKHYSIIKIKITYDIMLI